MNTMNITKTETETDNNITKTETETETETNTDTEVDYNNKINSKDIVLTGRWLKLFKTDYRASISFQLDLKSLRKLREFCTNHSFKLPNIRDYQGCKQIYIGIDPIVSKYINTDNKHVNLDELPSKFETSIQIAVQGNLKWTTLIMRYCKVEKDLSIYVDSKKPTINDTDVPCML